ncbi:MAG: hypothetical protein DRJ13_09640 [Bacteroidetes bacterium]|nr:MAG: hypothetical protein DRJ13_09640 [Bacteroidota bacterium]
MNWMKKVGLLIVVLLFLTACGSESIEVDVTNNSGDTAENYDADRERLRTDFADDALSPALQLVVGTFILEETDLVVDAELAEILLPYWKLYVSLLDSDSTAPEELTGLINEIEGLMTTEQINYIAGLELTQESMSTLIGEMGVLTNLRSDGAGEGDGTRPNRPEGMPEGTRPGGGQGGGMGEADGVDPELVATMQARRAEEDGSLGANRMIRPLIDALIGMLEGK